MNNIIGTYPGETNSMGISFSNVNSEAMDDNAFQNWVGAHKSQYKKSLEFLKGKITHVSFELFREKLSEIVAKFKNEIKERSFVAFVEPNKSQHWVTTIAMTQGFNASAYVRLGSDGANGLEYALSEISDDDHRFSSDYAIVDDGSYSGNQMANNISRANNLLLEKFKNRKPIFHILLPYITSTAKNKIEGLRKKGITVHLYISAIIQTVDEAIPKNLQTVKNVLWKNFTTDEQDNRIKSTALHWFDHKVPNAMSFPEVLANGLVTQPKDDNVRTAPIRFLPQITPPYAIRD